jgi:hypothetical protein
MTTSPQQQQQQQLGSPNLSQAFTGQEGNHPFTSQRVNVTAQAYYSQQRLQQPSHHMTSISPSGGGFSQTMAGNTNARLPQFPAKQHSGQQPARPEARGRKQGPQSNQRPQSTTQPSNVTTMGSYSDFTTQDFM